MGNKKPGNVFLKSILLVIVIIGLAFIVMLAFIGIPFDAAKLNKGSNEYQESQVSMMCAEKTGGFNLVNYRHSSGVYHEQETEDLHRRI